MPIGEAGMKFCLRTMIEAIRSFGAMRFAYCALRGLQIQ